VWCILDWVWSEKRCFVAVSFQSCFILCNLGGRTYKKGLKLNGRFSFWSMVKMLTDCEETNLHVSKETKEGLSCSLVKTSV
jgi:hypothetical protein